VRKKVRKIVVLIKNDKIKEAEFLLVQSRLVASKSHLSCSPDVREFIWLLSEFLIYGNSRLTTKAELLELYSKNFK
jgi:hypothetical protein